MQCLTYHSRPTTNSHQPNSQTLLLVGRTARRRSIKVIILNNRRGSSQFGLVSHRPTNQPTEPSPHVLRLRAQPPPRTVQLTTNNLQPQPPHHLVVGWLVVRVDSEVRAKRHMKRQRKTANTCSLETCGGPVVPITSNLMIYANHRDLNSGKMVEPMLDVALSIRS